MNLKIVVFSEILSELIRENGIFFREMDRINLYLLDDWVKTRKDNKSLKYPQGDINNSMNIRVFGSFLSISSLELVFLLSRMINKPEDFYFEDLEGLDDIYCEIVFFPICRNKAVNRRFFDELNSLLDLFSVADNPNQDLPFDPPNYLRKRKYRFEQREYPFDSINLTISQSKMYKICNEALKILKKNRLIFREYYTLKRISFSTDDDYYDIENSYLFGRQSQRFLKVFNEFPVIIINNLQYNGLPLNMSSTDFIQKIILEQ